MWVGGLWKVWGCFAHSANCQDDSWEKETAKHLPIWFRWCKTQRYLETCECLILHWQTFWMNSCVGLGFFKFFILVLHKSSLKIFFILCNLDLHCVSNHHLWVPRGLGFLFVCGGFVINMFWFYYGIFPKRKGIDTSPWPLSTSPHGWPCPPPYSILFSWQHPCCSPCMALDLAAQMTTDPKSNLTACVGVSLC